MKGSLPDPGSPCAELRRLKAGQGEHWDRVAAELDFADRLAGVSPRQSGEWRKLVADAVSRLTAEARCGGDGVDAVRKVEEELSGIGEAARAITIHCIGHAHLDMNWLWPWNDTVLTAHAMFDSVLALMEEFPDFRFSQSQAALYEAMERYSPSTARQMRAAIRRGQWEVTASAWVEGDRNLPCGESLVAQIHRARQYLSEAWGVQPDARDVEWAPDTFGHSAGYPQVLVGAGIRRCYLCRGAGEHKAFVWEGIDGSRVLVWNDASLWYLGTVTPSDVLVAVEHLARTGLKDYPMVFGVGDHGGGPTRRDILALRAMSRWPVFPRIRFSTAREFFDTLEPHAGSLPVVRGEMNGIFRGCYSSQARAKRAHRDAESRILSAESACVMASVMARRPYPFLLLRQAWKDILFNQFHDILPGSGTPDTYIYTRALLQNARAAIDVATREACRVVASPQADPQAEERRVVVLNPIPHRCTDTVTADVFDFVSADDPVELLDRHGTPVPFQASPGTLHDIPFVRFVFTARDVPGCGYGIYRLRKRSSPVSAETGAPRTGGARVVEKGPQAIVIENELLRLTIDPGSGALAGIVDRTTGQEVLPPGSRSSVLSLGCEAPHAMSSWDTCAAGTRQDLLSGAVAEVTEEGPARVTVTSRLTHGETSLALSVTLAAEVPRIDFRLLVDWHERGGESRGVPTLKVVFPFDLADPHAFFDVPFGTVERAPDGSDAPMLSWAEVTGKAPNGTPGGQTLIATSNHGVSIDGHEMVMTILRSSYEPDTAPDQGSHELEYSLVPRPGGCSPHENAVAAMARNRPFWAVTGGTPRLFGSMPQVCGLVTIQSESVVGSAVRLVERTGDIAVRLWETRGVPAEATLRFALEVDSITEADLLERPRGDPIAAGRSGWTVPFRPFEVKTLLVRDKDSSHRRRAT